MKKSILITAIFTLCLFTSCKKDKKEDIKTETDTEATVKEEVKKTKSNISTESKKVKVALESKSDSGVTGNAVFTQDKGVVTMIVVLDGLSEGTHAIHLHEKADCSAADGTSAGGHWNPTAQPHGKWGDEKGYHKGDIGNLQADAKGHAIKSFSTDEWCIGCGDEQMDILNKAIIVHQGADDYGQPTGNAGGRVSCGGIIQ